MKISVIIPVYNAEKLIEKAVKSSLEQKETNEVILVEDASTDNSLEICRNLEKKHSKVKLFKHFDGQNHGAGATRNLGIKNATFDYIAFLDADDYYLPERFNKVYDIFKKFPSIDGVYEATGFHYYEKSAKKKWTSRHRTNLVTLNKEVSFDLLFRQLTIKKAGYLHLDGIVVKKKLFEKCGFFFENLVFHQDTAIILQMALFGKFMPGRLNVPVAMRGIHNGNRVLTNYDQNYTKYLLWKTLFHWALEQRVANKNLAILYFYYFYCFLTLIKKNKRKVKNVLIDNDKFLTLIVKHPILFFKAILLYLKIKV
jgi:glycosyltransferase involved in cell wall biosynthesis